MTLRIGFIAYSIAMTFALLGLGFLMAVAAAHDFDHWAMTGVYVSLAGMIASGVAMIGIFVFLSRQ